LYTRNDFTNFTYNRKSIGYPRGFLFNNLVEEIKNMHLMESIAKQILNAKSIAHRHESVFETV